MDPFQGRADPRSGICVFSHMILRELFWDWTSLTPSKELPLTKTLQKGRLEYVPEKIISHLRCVPNPTGLIFLLKNVSCCAKAFERRAHPSWHRASTAACHSAMSPAGPARTQHHSFFSGKCHLLVGHCLEHSNRACCVSESFLLFLH